MAQYQVHGNQVLEQLVSQFTSSGYQTGQSYSLDQFVHILSSKNFTRDANNQIDLGIVEQIFEKADSKSQQKVTVFEFCQTLMEAESILKEKIEGAIQNINVYEKQKQQILSDALVTQEQYNQEGLCQDSQLFLEIKQIQFNAQLGDLRNEKFKLMSQCVCLEDQTQFYTNVFSFDQTMINGQFRFKINTKQQVLQIVLQTEYSSNLCDIELGIMLLEDQQIREEWVDMKDNDLGQQYEGGVGNVSLLLNLQWIHNKIKLLNQQQTEIVERIEELQNDKDDFMFSLQNIYQVFPDFENKKVPQESFYSQRNNHISHEKIIFEQKPVQQSKNQSRNQSHINNELYSNSRNISNRNQDNQEEMSNYGADRNKVFIEKGPVLKAKYISLGLLVFLMFLSFKKNIFLDTLLIAGYLIICYEKRYYRSLIPIVFGLLGSVLIDCAWLYLKTKVRTIKTVELVGTGGN